MLVMIGCVEKGEIVDVNYMEVYMLLKLKDQWCKGEMLESIEEVMQKVLIVVLFIVVVSYI